MRGAFRDYLKRYGLVYAVFMAASVLTVVISAAYLGKTKEEDKVDILLISEQYDKEAFEEYLSSVKPAYLKELNYRYLSPSDSYFAQILGSYGAIEADIFFVPFSKLEEINCSSLMLPLEQAKIQNIYAKSLSFYASDDVIYGFEISGHGFSNEKEEPYYACFNKTSMHLGELNGSSLDGALVTAGAFL